jgi:N-acetylglutamate synthase-like GNAT family acetyltransferase
VVPSHRRRGIGSQLVQLYIEKARAAALPMFFDLEPAGHDFFLSLGFKDTKYFEFDLPKWAPAYNGFGPFRLYAMTGDGLV